MSKNNFKDSELRSEGVQNLLNKNPHWAILKGNLLISVLLVISLSLVCYYVKYPDFVNSKITINFAKLENHNEFINGTLTVSQNELYKVKDGQKVIVKLYDFPYQEYGVLNATIQKVSTKNPSINIIFPKGLKTSYNKNIPFERELKGNGEIIVQDTRIIEKIFSSIERIL
ncbi:hypothetical protein [Chryseobacterium sp. JK1]|uniref:hypothetical protein n=1 Tax=Chryseobacterium sp. JK1 TaxID=874294 RepID=UPI003D68F047